MLTDEVNFGDKIRTGSNSVDYGRLVRCFWEIH